MWYEGVRLQVDMPLYLDDEEAFGLEYPRTGCLCGVQGMSMFSSNSCYVKVFLLILSHFGSP